MSWAVTVTFGDFMTVFIQPYPQNSTAIFLCYCHLCCLFLPTIFLYGVQMKDYCFIQNGAWEIWKILAHDHH